MKPWLVAHEKARAINDTHTEITFIAEEALRKKIEKVRELLAAKTGRDGSSAQV